MTLTPDERKLLELIAQAPEPVAMSSFFHDIHPPNFPASAPEDDPKREAWYKQQIELYGASSKLYEVGLVEIVHPANGDRPDLVQATSKGWDCLT